MNVIDNMHLNDIDRIGLMPLLTTAKKFNSFFIKIKAKSTKEKLDQRLRIEFRNFVVFVPGIACTEICFLFCCSSLLGGNSLNSVVLIKFSVGRWIWSAFVSSNYFLFPLCWIDAFMFFFPAIGCKMENGKCHPRRVPFQVIPIRSDISI